MSSRWQTPPSFGWEAAPLAGRYPGMEWFTGNPVSSSAQGILRLAARLLEMPASQGASLFFAREKWVWVCDLPSPSSMFSEQGNGLLRGGEGAKLSLQVLLGGLACIFSSDSYNDLPQEIVLLFPCYKWWSGEFETLAHLIKGKQLFWKCQVAIHLAWLS